MVTFVKLTDMSGEDFWVNPESVKMIGTYTPEVKDKSTIVFMNDKAIYINGSPEEVIALLDPPLSTYGFLAEATIGEE